MCLNAYKLLWMFKWARRIFRMPQSQLKWKCCAIALVINRNSMKKSVLQSQHRRREFMNERVKSLSQRCCDVSSRFFKWVYRNPWPLLVGIRRIPAYHVDYTTAFIQIACIKLIKVTKTFIMLQKFYISDKCCSLSIQQKLHHGFHKNIATHLFSILK